MPGVLIYQFASQYYSFVIADDKLYRATKKEIMKDGQLLWSKGRISFEELEDARKTKDSLVKRLNDGEKIKLKDLKKELDCFFK
jgi:hypothetical protein